MTTQEIGIPIDLSKGEFFNTVYLNGKLQLVELMKSDNGDSVYVKEGYWISETIKIAYKVTSFKHIVKDIAGNGNYKIYTQSSNNGSTWSDWKEINYTNGAILSQKDYYARIKILIIANLSAATFTVDEFNVKGKYSNKFINSSDGLLELKKKYEYKMTNAHQDESGIIFSKTIEKTKFKKIDSIRLIESK